MLHKNIASLGLAAVLMAAPEAAKGSAGKPAPLSPVETQKPAENAAPAAVTTSDAGKPAAAVKPPVSILGVSSVVAIPVGKNGKRGNKTLYDLSKLTAVGMSLAIKGREAKNLTSSISTANRNPDFATYKLGADGQPMYHEIEIKDQAGNVVSTKRGEKIVASRRVFAAYDGPFENDPDNADVRIFRLEDKTENA